MRAPESSSKGTSQDCTARAQGNHDASQSSIKERRENFKGESSLEENSYPAITKQEDVLIYTSRGSYPAKKEGGPGEKRCISPNGGEHAHGKLKRIDFFNRTQGKRKAPNLKNAARRKNKD